MSKQEDDVAQLVHNDELEQELQPHLNHVGELQQVEGAVCMEFVNPVLVDEDTKEQTETKETNSADDKTYNDNTNGSAQVENGSGGREVTVSSPPVYYSSQTGETNIVCEPVVIRQANGIHVIRTRECCHTPNHYSRERPLKLKHIKFLKGFSFVAVIIFFPLGIPAMYNAFKCEKEFHAGILRGDIDLARKLAKRSERLIIFSVMAALLVAVAVFAVVERKLMENDEDYWKYRANNRVLPSG